MTLSYQHLPALFLLICLPFFSQCQQPTGTQNGSNSNEKTPETLPAWLETKISEFKKAKPANPPIKIYRYLFQNQTVYYVTSHCCDIPGQVYSAEGRQLCQPDGGITGRGDGKCPDFFETRTAEKLVWEDLRN